MWQVSWAHPQFGVLLASCSFDGSVLIHRETRPREWSVIHAARLLHESSVNGVQFAPSVFGLQLAAASSDGRVSVLQHQAGNNTWLVQYLPDCPIGVNAVSWAPAGAFAAPDTPEEPRLVTAGCDNQIRFWRCQEGQWLQDTSISISTTSANSGTLMHTDWVRDVAWAPALLPNQNIVASCSEDRTVIIWKQTAMDDADNSVMNNENTTTSTAKYEWKPTLLHTFPDTVWRVSWSVTGHLLAVSSGDSNVTLWKAGLDGSWSQVSTVPEEPETQQG